MRLRECGSGPKNNKYWWVKVKQEPVKRIEGNEERVVEENGPSLVQNATSIVRKS